MKRRQFIAGASALSAVSLSGVKPSFSMTEKTIGTKKVMSLYDGHLTLPVDFIFGQMPRDQVALILEAYQIMGDAIQPDCNVTLIKDGARTILFDVGSGAEFQDGVGLLPDALDSIGVDPADITDVVFTHAHPDHIWGLLDDFGDPLFYNADYYMGQTEWDYWINPETVNTIDAARQAFAVGAKRRMELIADQVTMVNDGDEILPGITANATFGHTPGHMAYDVRDGADALMVLGDCIGNHHVAFEHPEWQAGSDQDPALAAETRVKLLDKIAADRIDVLGYHFPRSGLGHVEKHAQGYKFIAM